MKKGIALSLFLAAGLIGPDLATGAEENEKVMEKVVVTAGRVEEKAKNVTQAVTVISREEIAKNQQSDLGHLLRNHGFQVNAYPSTGTQSQLAIRGMRSSLMGDDSQGSILVLVNGRRAGTDNVSLIPLINVERVEVLRGPAAVQYGSSAIGGVVNIITRRGEKLAATAEAGIGSWSGGRALGEISGSAYGFDASGGVSWLTQKDSYTTGRKSDVYDNTNIEYGLGYNLNIGYTFLDTHRIGINYQGVKHGDSGSPGDINGLTPSDRVNRQNESVDFTYEGGYRDAGLSWMGRYFTGAYEYNYKGLYNDMFSGLPISSLSSDRNEYQGAQGQLSFSKSFLTLTGGVDWLNAKRSQKNFNSDPFYGYDIRDNNIRQEDLGIFALAKISLFDDFLILSGGIRNDNYTTEFKGDSKKYNSTTPSVGIAVNPLDWLSFRANYGESFRVPNTLAVMGYRDGFSNYIGNPNLDPEKAQSWDVGADVHYKSLQLGATYFETNYKDKITYQAVGFDRQFQNLPGTSRFRGIELQASYDIAEPFDMPFSLRPYVNLTHLFQYDDPDGKRVMYISDTDVSYGLNFNHPGWGLDVDLRVIYYGKQEITETNWTNPNYGRAKQIGGDTTADLYISKTIHNWENAGALSIKGELRNIFNKDYATIDYYPMPGRSFYIGLRYDY
ncbi:MAG: TonB-dependent receptor [Desulfovibrio sp.]|nr:TonB-dependent receptor [Desulfovibrio sp.]